ncbi:MAG: Hsp20/alpha crystallin family protein [Flavobacteriales bacterium]
MYPVRIKSQAFTPFNRLMEDLFENDFSFAAQPPVNIKQTENGFGIELAAPGFTKEEISVHVENKVLRIKGEHNAEKQENTEKYTRKEFSKKSFERSFTLPADIKEDDVKASFTDGVLRLELTRKENTKTVHAVTIG